VGTGSAKWCILSGSPAGIQNSHLKFYAAWLAVDGVREEFKVMNVCVSVIFVTTPFSVVGGLRSVIWMYCLLGDGDCSSITCLLPSQTTEYWNTRTSNTNASSKLYFCIYIYIYFHRLFFCTERSSLWANFLFKLSTVWLRRSVSLALLHFSGWLKWPVQFAIHRSVHHESVNHRGHTLSFYWITKTD
jgi:hypothetical protein